MFYDIGLRISYAYQTPAAGGRHVLCMTPADMAGQRAITSLLDVTPEPDERIARDAAKDACGIAYPARRARANMEAKAPSVRVFRAVRRVTQGAPVQLLQRHLHPSRARAPKVEATQSHNLQPSAV